MATSQHFPPPGHAHDDADDISTQRDEHTVCAYGGHRESARTRGLPNTLHRKRMLISVAVMLVS